MSEKFIIDVDVSEAERKLNDFEQRVSSKIILAGRRTLGIISSLAAMTGTTMGRQISLIISSASMAASVYSQIAAIEMTNPITVAFGIMRSAQIAILLHGIVGAFTQQGIVERELGNINMMISQFSALTGGLM